MLRAEKAFGLHSLPIELPEQIDYPVPHAPVSTGVSVNRSVQPTARPIQSPPKAAVAPKTIGLPSSDAPAVLFPSEPYTSPVLSTEEKLRVLNLLDDSEVKVCTKCRLCETRKKTAFGEGDPDAKIMFIGEGPGENEDLQGRPFVGAAGQLLDKMMLAMGLKREQVYICNIVKCRPPGNREPAPDETATCTPYLLKQIEIIRPQVIVTLGRPASQFLLQTKNSMGKMRGVWHSWRGIKLMPTYHPAYVLRDYTPKTRATVWSDLKLVLIELNLPVPAR